MSHSPGFLAAVDDAKTRIREVTVDEVRAAQDSGADWAFVDVREDREFAVDSCAGAEHIGKGVLERDVEERYPNKQKTMVLYCGGGFRSALAADALRAMGYLDARSMAGGIKAWRAAGLPLDVR